MFKISEKIHSGSGSVPKCYGSLTLKERETRNKNLKWLSVFAVELCQVRRPVPVRRVSGPRPEGDHPWLRCTGCLEGSSTVRQTFVTVGFTTIMTKDMVDIVVPGVRLCEADERHVAGPGTYAQHGYIYSSLLGQLRLVNTPNKAVSVEVNIVFYS